MSELKKSEIKKFRSGYRVCLVTVPDDMIREGYSNRDVIDIPYSEDDALFEHDHPDLFHEMRSRDLTLNDIRLVLARKYKRAGPINPEDLVTNSCAISAMYSYLAGLERCEEVKS